MNSAFKQFGRAAVSNTKCFKIAGIDTLGVLSQKTNCLVAPKRLVQANAGFPNLQQSAAANLAAGQVANVDFDPFMLVEGDLKTMFKV